MALYTVCYTVQDVSPDTRWPTPFTPPHFLLYSFPSPILTHVPCRLPFQPEEPWVCWPLWATVSKLEDLETSPLPNPPRFPGGKQKELPGMCGSFPRTVLLPKHSHQAFPVNEILHFITQVIQDNWTKGACWGLAGD